jgi:hypothetical protein
MAVFSDTVNNTGIAQQIRNLMRVDANQWPIARIVNSVNNYHDFVVGYHIAQDKKFNFDDSNHTKLPIGTTNIVANQSDYSFLTDEQGNRILNLLNIEIKDSDGNWKKLEALDESEETQALDEVVVSGTPTGYYKIADNIIRLNKLPSANVTAGLKFYFQRVGSYFTATDTTKEPGVSPLLHRGYVIAGAYDGALTLGLQNLQALSVEMQKEEQKMIRYFESRNNDEVRKMIPNVVNCK